MRTFRISALLAATVAATVAVPAFAAVSVAAASPGTSFVAYGLDGTGTGVHVRAGTDAFPNFATGVVDNAYQFEFAKLVRPDGTCERLDTRNCAVRREVLHAVGSFDDGLRYWGDAELGRRLVRAGHRIVYAPRMRVVHHDVARLAPLLGKAYRIGRVTEVTVRSMPDAWVWQSFPHLLRSEWWLRVRKVRQGAGALPWLLRAVASTAVHLVMLAWRLALKHPQAHRSLSLALAQIHGLGYLRVALEQRRTSAPRPLGGRLS